MKKRKVKAKKARTQQGYAILYECDPDKNIACNRKNCALRPLISGMPGPCHQTTNINFAKQPLETVKFVFPMSEEEFKALGKEANDENQHTSDAGL